ncbi:MAG: chromosomal replication initiator protein DnaA [Anaerolineae bacterium]|nr:chromosomal replication initiator protein DnaA [Anaerolineae bacterium]
MVSPKDAWQSTLGQLQLQLNPATFETWLEGTELLAYEDGEFVIRVRHAYAKDWIEKHLQRKVTQTLGEIFGRTVKVRFVIFLRNQQTVDPDAGPLFAQIDKNRQRQLELFNTALIPQKIEMPVATYTENYTDSQEGIDQDRRQDRLAAIPYTQREMDGTIGSITGQNRAGSQLPIEANETVNDDEADTADDDWPDYLEWDPRFSDVRRTPSAEEKERVIQNAFNERYTFQSFVLGPENHFAALAAQRVAEQTDTIYNPLIIHGEVGLGKTHLLHAIGQKSEAVGRTVLYVTAETFTNELVEAISNRKTSEFRERYRTVDVLLVDDIQFMIGKAKSEEEFYHTFNTIIGQGGQVVITSQQHPATLRKLDERLRVRLEGGLIVDLHAPESETRGAILKSKAREHGVELPDDVATILAEHPVSNLREMNGLLKQVLARAALIQQSLTPEWAEMVLENVPTNASRPNANRTPEIGDILDTVATHFQLTKADLEGKGRAKAVAQARHVAMYLAREITDASYPTIGEAIGGRNHSTIVYGYKKIAQALDADRDLRQTLDTIRRKLNA